MSCPITRRRDRDPTHSLHPSVVQERFEHRRRGGATPLALMRDPGHFLALGAGSGLAARAPGTAGTLVGALCYVGLAQVDRLYYFVLVGALFALGIWLCQRAALALGENDHPAIVWDEIVGYLATMAFVSPNLLAAVGGFVLFRLFDIFKPWPIIVVDRRVHGGLGVMLDDLLAAIYAGGALVLIDYLSNSY